MRESNIERLVNASPMISSLPQEVSDYVYDYFMDDNFNLENINVDDFIVNGINKIHPDEYDENRHSLIYKDTDVVYILSQ